MRIFPGSSCGSKAVERFKFDVTSNSGTGVGTTSIGRTIPGTSLSVALPTSGACSRDADGGASLRERDIFDTFDVY